MSDHTSRIGSPLYVIGHRNPDTDAICSAIGNAEYLRTHGYPNARAARCGELLPRTAWVLERAGVPVPEYISDVAPTAGDICTRNVISIAPGDTFLMAYNLMKQHNFDSIPVVDAEGKLHGILRFLDLLNLLMPSNMTDMSVRTVVACLSNIAKTLDATPITSAPLSEHDHEIILLVGASSEPTIRTRLSIFKSKGIAGKLLVICGDRPNVQLYAIEAGVRALVITADVHPASDLVEIANERGVTILSTKWDTASVGKLILCSRRVSDVVQRECVTFDESVPLAAIQSTAAHKRQDIFPVVNFHTQKVTGLISKNDLVDPPRLRVALVDHNELGQAVNGIEEAEIVEVMDHHRIGAQITSRDPIRFVIEPLGATSTLVARRFYHRDLQPSPGTAICLAAGILSDTLNLTSPTSTDMDRKMLEWLTGLTGINAEAFTHEFFSIGSVFGPGADASAIVNMDRKRFEEPDGKISLSQVEEVGLFGFHDMRRQLEEELGRIVDAEKCRLACLLITDVLKHDSLLLAAGDKEVIEAIEYERIDDTLFSAQSVVSRKKQLFPAIARALRSVR